MMFAGGQCGQSRTSRPSSVDDTRNPESRDTHSRWTQPCYYRLTVQMLKFFVAHALAYLIVVIGDSTAAASGNVTLSETTSHRTHLEEWLKTTDARLTSINTPMTSLDDTHPAPRAALDTVVVYCSKRVGDVCGGECTVYNGSAACLFTPHTQCIWASKDVGFCDKKDCDGNCRTFSGCGTFLRDGFCLALGTRSIVVSPL
ncbi:hypothetical protein C8Q78DRAFT_1057394 [Trametes maxima]|nr:hypothetical protein C8Q78DRAFT_1057394 [Trametes maxima]